MRKRIEYILFILILAFLYIWTNKKMTLWIVLIVIGMLALVVLVNQLVKRNINVTYEMLPGNESSSGIVQMTVVNKGIFPANHIESRISCYNVVFATAETKKFSISVGGRNSETFRIPVSSKYVGRIDLTVEMCRLYDWFDITYRTIKTDKAGCFYSFPKENFQEVIEIKDGASEGEETTYKHVVGNDVSEILQIREYRKGDSIKNIHWKISAKTGKTMVKELDCPNDNSILILFDYAEIEKKDINNKIITIVSNVSSELMKDRQGHTIYRMDTSKNRIVDRTVIEPEEYDIIQQELLETEAKKENKNVSDYIMDEGIYHQYAKIIYVRPASNNEGSGIETLEHCVVITV